MVKRKGEGRVWPRGRGRGGCGQGADRGGWVGRVDKWMCWYTVHHTHTQGSKCFQAANNPATQSLDGNPHSAHTGVHTYTCTSTVPH